MIKASNNNIASSLIDVDDNNNFKLLNKTTLIESSNQLMIKKSIIKKFIPGSNKTSNSLEKLDVVEEMLSGDAGAASNGDVLKESVTLKAETQIIEVTSCSNLDSSLNKPSNNVPVSSMPIYYELKVKLREGKNLAIRDIGGIYFTYGSIYSIIQSNAFNTYLTRPD
jgi:hypothetical protein